MTLLGLSACKANASGGDFTVTYQSNHGTTPATAYVRKGTLLNERFLPEIELTEEEKSKSSFIFGGWQLDGVDVTADDKITITSNITLKAVWLAKINYLSVNADTIEDYEFEKWPRLFSKTIPENSYLTESYLPVLKGYDYDFEEMTFYGWFNQSNYEMVTTDTKITAAVTDLRAVWKDIALKLNFKSAHGNTPKSITIAGGEGFDLSRYAKDLTDNEYDFIGWKFSEDEDSEILGDDKWISGKTVNGRKVIEFEAVWVPKDVTITFHANTGASPEVTNVVKIPYCTEAVLPAKPSTADWTYVNPSTGKTYKFGGWTTTPYEPDFENAEIAYTDKEEVVLIDDKISLYAYWITDRIASVTCDVPTGRVSPNTKVNLNCPANDGLGEDDEDVAIIYYTTNGTTPTKKSMVYNSGDGITLQNIGDTQTIKARAYPVDTSSNAVQSAISVFEFNVVSKLTLEKNTPDGAALDQNVTFTTTEAYGTKYVIPEDIYTCRGYKLLGYSEKPNATAPDYRPGDSVPLNNGEITLYTVWEKIIYTVSYDASGLGYYTPDSIKVEENYALRSIDLPKLTSEANKFTGWKDLNGTVVTPGYKVNCNLKLVAEWKPINCEISYELPFDSSLKTPETVSVSYKTKISNAYLPKLELDGWYFDGWYMDETETYEDEDGKDQTKVVSKKVTDGSFLIYDDITLYAKAHKKYNVLDKVMEGDNLVAVIIKASTENEPAIGVGAREFIRTGGKKYRPVYIDGKSSDTQKLFYDAIIPSIIAYEDLSGDTDGSDNLEKLRDYLRSKGCNAWDNDSTLKAEAKVFWRAEHYSMNETDPDDVYFHYEKYKSGWYIPTLHELKLFFDANTSDNTVVNMLKQEYSSFGVTQDSLLGSSNCNPAVPSSTPTGIANYMWGYSKGSTVSLRKYWDLDYYTIPDVRFIFMRKFED